MGHIYVLYVYKELFATKMSLNSLPGLQGFWTSVTEMILQKAAIASCSLDET